MVIKIPKDTGICVLKEPKKLQIYGSSVPHKLNLFVDKLLILDLIFFIFPVYFDLALDIDFNFCFIELNTLRIFLII